MEYIYKLNLPNLEDCVIAENFATILANDHLDKFRHLSIPADQLFQKEYLEIKGIKFDMVSIFSKFNSTGRIHVDDNEKIREESDPCFFGINWLYNGTGNTEFWKKSNIDSVLRVPDAVGTYNIRCVTAKQPDKVYNLYSGFPYLFNASVPHRATGVGQRYVFSLRSMGTRLTWQDVRNHFNELIIN